MAATCVYFGDGPKQSMDQLEWLQQKGHPAYNVRITVYLLNFSVLFL